MDCTDICILPASSAALGRHSIKARNIRKSTFLLIAGVILLTAGCKAGNGNSEIANVLLALLVALVAAKLGGELFVRAHQPAVLGELVLGIVVGNLTIFGYHGLEFIGHDCSIEVLADLGVVLLLFQVGLESDLRETMSVGASSFIVATLGVIAPAILGWIVAALWLPQASVYVHMFIGATLCATSVGITARVLKDLGRTQTAESNIVLGAAVIDDVLGLVILAIVQGAISAASSGKGMPIGTLCMIMLKALVFMIGAPLIGRKLAPKLFRFFSRFKAQDLLLITALAICFGFAYLASLIGLAPIVGAFTAGLILEETHWRYFRARGEHSLNELIAPLVGFLTPVFFFRMGTGVVLTKLIHPSALLLAAALTAAAILGKQVCGLGVLQKGIDRLSIGIGMIPRGEVGLIFAAIGAKLTLDGERIIEPTVFSALVIMIVCTTLVTPPLLKWSLSRRERTILRAKD